MNSSKNLNASLMENSGESFERRSQERFIALDVMMKKETNETRSAWWYLLFPIILLLWPVIRICYYRNFNFSFCAAILSLITLTSLYFNVFTVSLYIYFFVNYGAVVFVEYNVFLKLPIDKLGVSVKKAVAACEDLGIFYRISPERQQRLKYILAGTFATIFIADIVVTVYYKITTDSYDGTIGSLTSTFLHINESALFTFVLLKSIEFAYFYVLTTYDLREIDTHMSHFFASYDSKTICKTSLVIRDSVIKWRSVFRTFALMDFAQTFSFVVLLFLCIARDFVKIPVVTEYLENEEALMNETKVFTDGSEFTIAAYLGFSAWALTMKLIFSFKATSIHSKMKSQLNELKTHLSYIAQLPESFIEVANMKEMTSSQRIDQVIEWKDVRFNQETYETLFQTKENIFEPLIKFIKEQQGKNSLTYKQLMESISKYALLSLERLRLVENEYDKFYNVIEYKLFGIFAINKGLMVKLGTALLTAAIGWVWTFARNNKISV